MKNLFLLQLLLLFALSSSAQWTKIFTLNKNESFEALSAPSDNNVWIVANNSKAHGLVIYKTNNAGKSWSKKLPGGLAVNTFLSQFYAVNNTTAFLEMNTGFTGHGPGIIYRTTDGGGNWVQVFMHHGNCEFLMGMFDEKKGLMSCSFSNSTSSGQSLYKTQDSGKVWNIDTLNPSNGSRMNGLEINNGHAAMVDYNNFYFSNDGGESWATQRAPLADSYFNHLQFVNRNYVMVNESSLVNLFIRRGSSRWQKVANPAMFDGAVTGLLLDSSECWLSMALDDVHEYYSSDSAKTFTAFIIDSLSAFLITTKARNGRTFFGATYGTAGRLWMNERREFIKSKNEILITAK